MPAEHTYWKILKGKMKVADMIFLSALSTSPLKCRVMGFWVGVGARADVQMHFGAQLRPLGIVGQDDRWNERVLYGQPQDLKCGWAVEDIHFRILLKI